MSAGGILEEILAHKREELTRARERVDELQMRRLAEDSPHTPLGLKRVLRSAPAPRIVAEVKRRSPSKGEIRGDFEPVSCARAYAEAGAAAISVLTDERYFGGHLDFVRQIRGAVDVPLLRKDFVVDAYQIDEARAAGADAVLLIVAALARGELASLRDHALKHQLDALVEVHDAAELAIALDVGADLIGINNRNLRTFETSLATTEDLAPRIPAEVTIVSESGIFTPEDVARLAGVGTHAYLVGESLMREADVGEALRRLRRTP